MGPGGSIEFRRSGCMASPGGALGGARASRSSGPETEAHGGGINPIRQTMIDLDRFREGDRSYLGKVIRAHGRLVFMVVKGFSDGPDQAEDLFQEVWIKVLENRTSYLGRGPFEAWLHRVALNVCRMDARKGAAREAGSRRLAQEGRLEDLSWASPNPLSDVLLTERRSFLKAAMGRLSPRERETINLRVIQGKTSREVAQMMEIEESTVRSQVRKGINRLRVLNKESADELSGS